MSAPAIQSHQSNTTSKVQGIAERLDKLSISNGANGFHDVSDTSGYQGMNGANGYYESSSPILHSPTSTSTKTSILREKTIQMSQSMRVLQLLSSDYTHTDHLRCGSEDLPTSSSTTPTVSTISLTQLLSNAFGSCRTVAANGTKSCDGPKASAPTSTPSTTSSTISCFIVKMHRG